MSHHGSRVALDAYDYEDEPVHVPEALAEEFHRRAEEIERQTPAWVRRCRALGHYVALMSAPPRTRRCRWQCTRCGKDRA
jgi:hypothetical protein